MKKLNFLSTLLLIMLVSISVSAKTPKVVAHRGYWDAPGSAENSIRSMIKADSIGCYATEFDVWITADNQLVLNHNPSIAGHVIETSTLEDLKDVRLKNGEKIPMLSDFLDSIKPTNLQLVFELKPHKDVTREDVAIPMIIKMIADKGLTDRTMYITFSRNAFDKLVAQSGRPVQFLTGMDPDKLKAAGGWGPDFHISVFRKNPDWVKRFKELNMPINVWTVSNRNDIGWCIEHDVDFVTTNTPELALEMIAEAQKPLDLKVLTYNLRFGEFYTIDSLAEYIRSVNPDFVALQEVDVNTYRKAAKHQNGKNVVTELSGKTGMFGYYGRTIDFAGGLYGIAILSKYPAISTERFELPNPKNVEPRVLLLGTFELPGNRLMRFGCTHFDYKHEATRTLQMEYLLNKLSGSDIPTLFAGDLNAEPNEEAINLARKNALMLTSEEVTFPSTDPKSKIDYIFGIPAKDFKLISTEVPNVKLSDHRPVVSEIEVKLR